MIEVETLLRRPDGSFVQVERVRRRPPDGRYIKGAINLSINGKKIISEREWDYIDQLWSYISNLVGSLAVMKQVSTYFPDQPVFLEFRRSGREMLIVSCKSGAETRQANVGEREFLNALRTAGDIFFRKMSALLPENSEGYEIARLSLMS
ncbi:hypothetical protein ND748_11395 [Frankia sp. AiPs1]|uniref:hypothetical protein n=1 Tax=Frankia sp. AiPs1 TaxID=573493 RepID=UPI002042F222|nr:hypothetical protein [Frankia sp. AiPs1]MCM3922259.1 hypothetical protein [Frankia sp. AiPs1]